MLHFLSTNPISWPLQHSGGGQVKCSGSVLVSINEVNLRLAG